MTRVIDTAHPFCERDELIVEWNVMRGERARFSCVHVGEDGRDVVDDEDVFA